LFFLYFVWRRGGKLEKLKMRIKDKRGTEQAIWTAIALILAIVLLALLIVFVTGGFKKFGEKIGLYSSASNVDSFVENCNALAAREAKFEYCCSNKTLVISSKEKHEVSCNNVVLSNYSWAKNMDKLNCEEVC